MSQEQSPPPGAAPPLRGEGRAGGLTDVQADRIRSEVGPNEIPERPPPGVGARFANQLRDPMIMLLLGAAALTVLLGDMSDLAVIGTVIVLNSAVGVAQEIRSERALRALRELSAPVARVWRDGALVERPAAVLVPGDVIVLEAGDVVPADGTLDRAETLAVDEAALTGESVPVDKRAVDGDSEAPDVLVQAGTVVTHGRGTALVTAVGPASALGRIAVLLGEQRPRPTPLQTRLRGLGRILAISAVVLSAVVMVSGLLRGRPLSEVVLTAISLAVAAVPESLPAVVTLALALGAGRMARRSAIVRGLPAVETLGSVTVLVTDKTGTLTEGRMMVERAIVDGHELAVSGIGYAPAGTLTPMADAPGPDAPDEALTRLLRDVVLCNDADLGPPDEAHPGWWGRGDTTEVALVAFAAKGGVAAEDERRRSPRVAEAPFDSIRKRMTTIHRGGDGYLIVCKGAPDTLLETPGLLAPASAPQVRAAADRLAEAGFRVLAVAEATTAEVDRADAAAAERDLDLVGLVGITDPPRTDAGAVVNSVRDAGVEIVMVTGDHPATARTIARRVGIREGGVLTGADLDDGRVSGRGPGLDPLPTVFARTRPEQKLDIVAALQDRGDVVAMTGDGVNDAPALRRADIGVAMGRGGTEVAKQAADLVLTDDNLSTVVAAIAEGRRIYSNIRTFLRYALAGGLAEVLVMLAGPAVGLAIPLLPAQILWINLMTHGLPGVAFGAEPGDPDAMRRPPRPPDESVLGRGLWRQVAVTAVLIAVVSLALPSWYGGTEAATQTAVFWTLGVAQLGVALSLRRARPRRSPLGFLDLAVLAALLLQLAAVYVDPLADVLGTQALPWHHCVVLALAASVPGLVLVLRRLVRRLRSGADPRRRPAGRR